MTLDNKWWEGRNYPFLKLPVVLFETEKYKCLSSAAKLLYALLFDRVSLSAANGWADSHGRTFVYFSIREACQKLSCGHDKVTKAMRELEAAGLLLRKRQGQGKPDRLYVLPFSSECDISAHRDTEIPHPETPEGRKPKCGEAAPNHTENNQTENSNINLSIYPADRDGWMELVKKNIDFDVLIEQNRKSLVQEIVQLMADTLLDPRPTIRIGGTDRTADEVREKLLRLNRDHIDYVLLAMQKNRSEIHNIRAYLLTALYHAPDTMDSYYEALVAHDMAHPMRYGT